MRGFSRPRFSFILFGVFASLGLVLAGIGVFGVISKSVAQRTPEFGIRMAIGASATDIAGMVLRGGLSLVLLGLVIGLGGAYSAARYLASEMREFTAFDLTSAAAVSAVLLFTGLAACVGPAWRAIRIDPALALRNE
jgi:putative ABC transport system permease protein